MKLIRTDPLHLYLEYSSLDAEYLLSLDQKKDPDCADSSQSSILSHSMESNSESVFFQKIHR